MHLKKTNAKVIYFKHKSKSEVCSETSKTERFTKIVNE